MPSFKNTGKLFLVPVPISGDPSHFPEQASYILSHISEMRYFVVENVKTARRFLRKFGFTANFDEEVNFVELNKRSVHESLGQIKGWLKEGHTIGVLSEAGCPGVADPGAEVVALAHEQGVQVRPLIGPSSILLTLMASGLNGQNFAFKGYVPIDRGELRAFIAQCLADISHKQTTCLFMDTPYRNERLFEFLLENLPEHIHLCIGKDLTGNTELVITKTIKDWKKAGKPILHKIPLMFAIGIPQSQLF